MTNVLIKLDTETEIGMPRGDTKTEERHRENAV